MAEEKKKNVRDEEVQKMKEREGFVEFRLPDTTSLESVKMTSYELEDLVKRTLGLHAGRGVKGVVLKGGPKLAFDPDVFDAGVSWTKTIWSRAC